MAPKTGPRAEADRKSWIGLHARSPTGAVAQPPGRTIEPIAVTRISREPPGFCLSGPSAIHHANGFRRPAFGCTMVALHSDSALRIISSTRIAKYGLLTQFPAASTDESAARPAGPRGPPAAQCCDPEGMRNPRLMTCPPDAHHPTSRRHHQHVSTCFSSLAADEFAATSTETNPSEPPHCSEQPQLSRKQRSRTNSPTGAHNRPRPTSPAERWPAFPTQADKRRITSR